MQTLRIGMVLAPRTYPPDIRIDKEARALVAAGHEIILLCQADAGLSPLERIGDVTVVRHPGRRRSVWGRGQALMYALTGFDLHWGASLSAFIRHWRPHVLHIHDLYLVGTAERVAGRWSVPVVADLHENYPASLQVWLHEPSALQRLTNHYGLWQGREQRWVRRADHTIVVVEEARARLLEATRLPPDRITVVSNTEDPTQFLALPVLHDVIAPYQNRFLVTYAGGFGPHRGLEVLIDAVATARDEIPDILLALVGDGPSRDRLEARASAAGCAGNVLFTGWVGMAEVRTWIEGSAICVVPHNASDHTNSTVPHKLFQYMAAGRPVVVSSCLPLARIVRETGAGLVFEAGNAADLARCLLALRPAELRTEMAAAGQKAVAGPYAWSTDASRLTAVYGQLGGRERVGVR